MLKKGDAFWLKGTGSSANPGVSHLHCVLTNPCSKNEQLIANITSRHPGVPFDLACPLGVGDHPDITKPSFVLYERARVVWPKAYEVWVFGHQMTATTAFSIDVLERIRKGLLASEFATPKNKTYFTANGSL